MLFEHFIRNVPSPLTLLTSNAPEDQRNKVIENQLSCEKYTLEYSMELSSTSTTHASIIDTLIVKSDSKTQSYNPKEFIQEIAQNNTDILIDITGFHIRLLGMILSGIKENLRINKNGCSKIFCGYTEPAEYKRNNLSKMFGSILHDDGTINDPVPSQRFELYKRFAGFDPIPNFSSIESDDEDVSQTWIVLLGFEGGRPTRIETEISKVDEVIALLTVPPLKPGWNNYALDENAHFLAGVDNRPPTIEYISAHSPYSAYNFLEKYKKNNPSERILVSPLSTKATSLGAILYALNYPECALIFDNPFETHHEKSEHFGKTYVFDISEVLRISAD